MAPVGRILAIQLTLLLGCVLAENLISNGDFENGLDNWSVNKSAGVDFYVAFGSTLYVLPNQLGEENSTILVGEQFFISAGVVYQEFTVPPGAVSILLNFQYWYYSDADIIVRNNTLDYEGISNQQFRVDLFEGDLASDPFDMASIYQQLFVTEEADIGDNWIQFHEEVAVTAEQSYTFRIAVVTTEGPLNLGIDNVNVTAVFEETSSGHILKAVFALTTLLSAFFVMWSLNNQ